MGFPSLSLTTEGSWIHLGGRVAKPLVRLLMPVPPVHSQIEGLREKPNILIYFFFAPITRSCSVSNVLFTGGRRVSDFSVLK